MIKISEMAKLANTTRRTLIFYDEQGVFQPKKRSDAGYRYYDYDQLYDLLFILAMKNLGLSLEKIKSLQDKPSNKVMDELVNVQTTIDKKMDELAKIQSIVSRKVSEGSELTAEPYQPIVAKRPKLTFWCSRESVSCTEEEIAQLFAEFYQQLDKLALMDGNQSGFLTDLPEASSKKYADASFRVVKESSTNNSGKAMPKIEKAAGTYLLVRVDNSTAGVCRGLDELAKYAEKNDLELSSDMWQMNTDKALVNCGGSEDLWLEYLIK
jgi:Predicted transcriptional regulators